MEEVQRFEEEKQKLINYREKLALFFSEEDFFEGVYVEEQQDDIQVEEVESVLEEQTTEEIITDENLPNEAEANVEDQPQE